MIHSSLRCLVVLVSVTLAASAAAQGDKPSGAPSPVPGSEDGRFTLSPVPDGQLRLDTRTGQVSICRKKHSGWTCELVADDRAAYEQEIARLQDRVTKLEGSAKRDGQEHSALPSEAEVDRIMKFFEGMYRRFLGMIEDLRREKSDQI